MGDCVLADMPEHLCRGEALSATPTPDPARSDRRSRGLQAGWEAMVATGTPTVANEDKQRASDGQVRTAGPDTRRGGTLALAMAFQAAFGERWEYAWEVARCESGLDPLAVGNQGELGIYQLHPQGVLPVFYSAGYDEPFDPFQQIRFVAAYTAENGWGAWSCAP